MARPPHTWSPYDRKPPRFEGHDYLLDIAWFIACFAWAFFLLAITGVIG